MGDSSEQQAAAETTSVAVGILRDSAGRVLMCQRPAGGRYPLKWEFPGGKVEPGESPDQALVRELREELTVGAREFSPFHRETAHYADGGRFVVTFYLVTRWDGTASGRSFSAIAWLMPEELDRLDILDGSRQVCRMLTRGHGRPDGDRT